MEHGGSIGSAPADHFDAAGESPRQAAVTILYLIDELCGIGGAELALSRIVRELPRDRFRPVIATFRCAPGFALSERYSARVHVLPLQRTYDAQAVRVAWSLRRLILREQVDIVHTFFATADLWGGVVAALSGGPIHISSRRDTGFQRSWLHRIAYRNLRFLFDEVHAVSDDVRRRAIDDDRLRPEKVVTVYTGVDLPGAASSMSREELRARLGVPSAHHVVITVGNVRRVKGIDILLRAASAVASIRSDVAFVVVGELQDRPYYQELASMARTPELAGRVCFWGPERSVLPLLRAADVFCLLSRTEGFSNAIVEAMACGLPSVVSRVGGNAEAIRDGVTGYLVPPDDPGAASKRLLELLNASTLRRSMGNAARRDAEDRFSTSAMLRRLTAEYERLLAAQAPRRRRARP